MSKFKYLIFCILCITSINAFAQKSADDVWRKYKLETKPNIYTFIDGLTASNEPKTFIQYIPEFVNISIRNGISIKDLKDELKETILPKDSEVATYFAVCLCKKCKSYTEVFEILNILPPKHQFYNGSKVNTSAPTALDNSLMEIMGESVNEEPSFILPKIDNVVIFQDGRIAMQFEDPDVLTPSKIINGLNQDFYGSGDLILLYNPNGTSCAGYFKNANKDAVILEKLVATDTPELYVGETIDKTGKVSGDKFKQYNSYEEANAALEAKKKAKETAEIAEGTKVINAFIKRLKQKYGEKAFNAINYSKYYKGMPIGIFKEFKYYNELAGRWMTVCRKQNTYFDKERRVYVTRFYDGLWPRCEQFYFVHGKLIGWQ